MCVCYSVIYSRSKENLIVTFSVIAACVFVMGKFVKFLFDLPTVSHLAKFLAIQGEQISR